MIKKTISVLALGSIIAIGAVALVLIPTHTVLAREPCKRASCSAGMSSYSTLTNGSTNIGKNQGSGGVGANNTSGSAGSENVKPTQQKSLTIHASSVESLA